MLLPGVPRKERIQFVSKLLRLLLEEGLYGITQEEHKGLMKMVEELLSTVEPVPEPLPEPQSEPAAGC